MKKQTNKQTKKQIKNNKIKHFFISIILVLKVKVKTFIVEPLWTPVSNIWILLYLLIQFPFTARETKRDYFHQEVNEPISSRVSKQFKTYIEKGHEKVLGNHKTEYKQSGKNSRNLKEINHQTFNKISTWSDSINQSQYILWRIAWENKIHLLTWSRFLGIYNIIGVFSFSKAFSAAKTDIQSNWDETNNSESTTSYVFFQVNIRY